MKRRVHMARLGIALISFTNGTAALAAVKAPLHGFAMAQVAIEAAGPFVPQVRVQRLPRVPRREPFEAGPAAETATGGDA